MEVVDVLAQRPGAGNLAAFYAAGTGVMFLLFMCAGAGGSLLEEMESGTLDRILGSRLGMGGLLAGKWLFLTLMGIAQMAVGLLTFNGWALDGYVKVFWRGVPVRELWPQLLVLALLTIVFLGAARLLARRWETV